MAGAGGEGGGGGKVAGADGAGVDSSGGDREVSPRYCKTGLNVWAPQLILVQHGPSGPEHGRDVTRETWDIATPSSGGDDIAARYHVNG